MRTILMLIVAVGLSGCCLTRNGVGPVVSPTNVGTEVQGSDKPTLPPMRPWYYDETNAVQNIIE